MKPPPLWWEPIGFFFEIFKQSYKDILPNKCLISREFFDFFIKIFEVKMSKETGLFALMVGNQNKK